MLAWIRWVKRTVGGPLSDGISPRSAATAAFRVQLVAVVAVILIAGLRSDLQALSIAVPALIVTWTFFLFHLRGHAWPRPAFAILLSLLVGVATPEPFVTQNATFAVIVPLAVGFVLGGPFMVSIAAGITWTCLAVRAGFRGTYLDPMTILFLALIVVLLRIGRLTLVHESHQAGIEHALVLQRESERDAARKQSEERARMFNVMAHELNNVLTPVNVQIYLLEEEVQGHMSQQQRKSFEILRRAKERTSALVNDMLDYARVETGNLKLNKRRVDAARLAQEAVDAYRPVARQGSVMIELEAQADATVETDPTRASQVLSNLLSNAIKYSPPGGAVKVQVGTDAHGVHLAVRDRGVGLTPDEQARLFQPFSQVHTDPAKQKPGTGLGLYISHQLAVRLGGGLRCRSEGPGRGAEFVFDLPRPHVA